MTPFKLSKATISDMPELMKLMYNCFDSWSTIRLMGCSSVDDISKIVDHYEKILTEDPTDIWVKVVDNQTGKIISASNWKLYVGSEKALVREHHQPLEWLSDEMKEEVKMLMKPLNDARAEGNPDPFLYLNLCFTAEEYRRRGAGRMMMQWANNLADSLFIPCYVESSTAGMGLYKGFGYVERGIIVEADGQGIMGMRRHARTAAIEGGKTISNVSLTADR